MPEVNIFSEVVIESQAVVMLLMIPIVATIVGIARYVIGIKSLGVYAPLVLTFSFYALGLREDGSSSYSDIGTGIKYGLSFVLIAIATTVAGSHLIKRWRMHYFPKVSIMISLTALMLLAAISFWNSFGYGAFTSINALAFVFIATVAEQFASTLFKMKVRKALLLTLETLGTSIVSYMLIAWPAFQDYILERPYLVLLTFVINYVVGRYRGLRIREFLRFREVLNSPDEPK